MMKVNELLHKTMRSLNSLLLLATMQATCEELVGLHHRADLLEPISTGRGCRHEALKSSWRAYSRV